MSSLLTIILYYIIQFNQLLLNHLIYPNKHNLFIMTQMINYYPLTSTANNSKSRHSRHNNAYSNTINNIDPNKNQMTHTCVARIFIYFISSIVILTLVTQVVSSLDFSNDINVDQAASKVARPNDVLELTSDNFESSTGKYMIVVLNFYADWCPFSARWKPVFQQTAKEVYNQTATSHASNTIIFGQVNCVIETTLAQKFRVTKFPTTKLTIDGKVTKKEYRGARNSEAFKGYIMKVLKDPVIYINNYVELHNKADEKTGALILFSNRQDDSITNPIESVELSHFRRISRQLREDCQFFYVVNSASSAETKQYRLAFKQHHKPIGSEISYESDLKQLEAFTKWGRDNCIPLVREITFENAEELTEEGLPFVILFYEPADKAPIELYKRVVELELRDETSGVTFLFADGHVFSHPLLHLGKTKKDLPLIAIDSFRHLFLYRHPVESISQPGRLKQFIDDLHSGKLDREFHFGPDPAKASDQSTTIPESAFQKLAPSPKRYSFMRDEL